MSGYQWPSDGRVDLTRTYLVPSRAGLGISRTALRRVLAGRYQPEPPGRRRRLGAGGDAELGQDIEDVDAGGLGADEQGAADLAVALAGGDQRENLGLARGQPDRRRGGWGL